MYVDGFLTWDSTEFDWFACVGFCLLSLLRRLVLRLFLVRWLVFIVRRAVPYWVVVVTCRVFVLLLRVLLVRWWCSYWVLGLVDLWLRWVLGFLCSWCLVSLLWMVLNFEVSCDYIATFRYLALRTLITCVMLSSFVSSVPASSSVSIVVFVTVGGFLVLMTIH